MATMRFRCTFFSYLFSVPELTHSCQCIWWIHVTGSGSLLSTFDFSYIRPAVQEKHVRRWWEHECSRNNVALPSLLLSPVRVTSEWMTGTQWTSKTLYLQPCHLILMLPGLTPSVWCSTRNQKRLQHLTLTLSWAPWGGFSRRTDTEVHCKSVKATLFLHLRFTKQTWRTGFTCSVNSKWRGGIMLIIENKYNTTSLCSKQT